MSGGTKKCTFEQDSQHKCATSVKDCAMACNGVSSMFALGTNNFGTTRCDENGCACLCERSASEDGSCSMVDHKGYILYKYTGTG